MSSTQEPGDDPAAVATALTQPQLIDLKFDFAKCLLECAIDSGLLSESISYPAGDTTTWHAPLQRFVAAPDGVNQAALITAGVDTEVVTFFKKLCAVISEAEATEGADKLAEDFLYVTDSPPPLQPMTSLAEVVEEPDVKWKGMARRLLHMCGFWSRELQPPHKDRKFFYKMEVGDFEFFHEYLWKKLHLDVGVCDPDRLSQPLENLAMKHICEGSTFFKLTFIATSTTANELIRRTAKQTGDIVPNPEVQEAIAYEDAVAKPQRARNPAVKPQVALTKVGLSGETGTGKTASALATACAHPDSVTIYTTAKELFFSDVEKTLGQSTEHHVDKVHNALLEKVKLLCNPSAPSKKGTAILIIDELGGCPRVTRALCKISTAALCEHFKIARVVIFAVGTGVDYAMAAGGSMPPEHRHFRTSMKSFDAVRQLYSKNSKLWVEISRLIRESERTSGIFGKLSRLSENARMGSILIAYEDVLEEMPPDLSIGAKRTFLRESAATVVWEALRVIKRVNGLYAHSALQALTEFGCAFAIACSDVRQDLSKAQDIIQTFGLLEDLAEFEIDSNLSGLEERLETAKKTFEVHENTAKKSFAFARGRKHRCFMSAATVEIGAAAFGLWMPTNGWDAFVGLFCTLVHMHAHAAMCATGKGIKLSDIPASDPLHGVKNRIRKMAIEGNATAVAQCSLPVQVAIQKEAAESLAVAAENLGLGHDRSKEGGTCIVVARNAEEAPLADVIVGVVEWSFSGEKRKATYKTTSMLLVQLKHYKAEPTLTARDAWLELYKMGCKDHKAALANFLELVTEQGMEKAKEFMHPDCRTKLTGTFATLCDDPSLRAARAIDGLVPIPVEMFVVVHQAPRDLHDAHGNDARNRRRSAATSVLSNFVVVIEAKNEDEAFYPTRWGKECEWSTPSTLSRTLEAVWKYPPPPAQAQTEAQAPNQTPSQRKRQRSE